MFFVSLVLIMLIGATHSTPVALNSHTFSSTVARRTVLVLFHTSWCKNCIPAREIFGKLSDTIPRENVTVAIVDAEAHRSITHKESIRSFPSIFLYRDGLREPYEGPRKFEDILRFVKNRCYIP